MDRTVILLIVAAVGLAGCAAGSMGGPPTNTTATASPTAPPVEEAPYPDGASADGLESGAFMATYDDAIREAGSYSVTLDFMTDGGESGSAYYVHLEGEVDLASNAVNYTRNSSFEGVTDTYHNGTTGFERTRGEDGDKYDRPTSANSAKEILNSTSGQVIDLAVRNFEFEATDTERRNGSVLITYESTGLNDSAGDVDLLPNSSATLVTDESGVVRSLSLTAVTRSAGKTNLSLRHFNIGSTTVERPEWVDTAEEEEEEASASPPLAAFDIEQGSMTVTTENGSATIPVVTIQHTSGESAAVSDLELLVMRDGDLVGHGYDVTSLHPDDGRLKSADPFPDGDVMGPSDTIRVVHVVPEEHHDSLRLYPERGAITANDGAIENGQLRPGDEIQLIWSNGDRTNALATFEVS